MQLNLTRTQASLESLGFKKVRQDIVTFQSYFVRNSSSELLSEWIYLIFGGKKMEKVGAYAVLSAVSRGSLIKGLSESTPLLEIAEDQERGWTEIRNDADSLEWETKLLACIPNAINVLKTQWATPLLQRTLSARKAAEKYFAKLEIEARKGIVVWYSQHPARELKTLASDLSQRPGVCALSNSHWIYEIAIFTILLWAPELEARAWDFNPIRGFSLDQQLVWRIQLLVDRIIARENIAI